MASDDPPILRLFSGGADDPADPASDASQTIESSEDGQEEIVSTLEDFRDEVRSFSLMPEGLKEQIVLGLDTLIESPPADLERFAEGPVMALFGKAGPYLERMPSESARIYELLGDLLGKVGEADPREDSTEDRGPFGIV